ncbi:hypothetical protein [Actinoplanes nipponensis]|uniref:hypothetical protein n=1 Tax=Actinoplanes nipponensis TaxID=135950 RepID=UPI0031E626A8
MLPPARPGGRRPLLRTAADPRGRPPVGTLKHCSGGVRRHRVFTAVQHPGEITGATR